MSTRSIAALTRAWLSLVAAASIVMLPSVATGATSSAPSDFAAFATGTGCGAITISGNSYVDSFDSSKGTYTQTKQKSGGVVGTNGNVTLSGQAVVYGSLAALNTAVGTCRNGTPGISLSGGAIVTAGYIRLSARLSFPNPGPVVPGTKDYILSADASLSPGSYRNISISGGHTLTLAPGIYNINSIVLSGQSRLTVSPMGQVIINVAGTNISQPIQLSGGTIYNPSGTPLNFQLVYGGSLPIALSGASMSYAFLYAPNSAVTLSGGGDWFGALVVNTLNDSGGSPLHFDRHLAIPPTITAALSPSPNAAGWDKANVTVSFACSDPILGIASCTSPITVTTEGKNQTVTGTAVNKAGINATVSVSVNLDKTPPTLSITSPANGSIVTTPGLTVTGSVSDSLSGVSTVTCNGVPASVKAGAFSCLVTLAPGGNTISVQAFDVAGNSSTQSVAVTLASSPSITLVSPSSGKQGQQALSIAITGQSTHFVQGTTVAAFGAGIMVASLTVNSATSATAVVNIAPTAVTGSSAITLTTGTEVASLANGFTVTAGTPLLTQVSPNTGQQGQTNLSVTLTGQFTHWVQGTSTASFGAGITVNSLTVNSATSATAVVSISATATAGASNVTVTTGTEIVTLANGFTVTAGTPLLTQVTPNTGQQGQQNLSVTLTGQFTHFVQGTTTALFGTGITVVSVAVSSATSATAVFNIDPATTTGLRTVTVTTGTEVATLNNGFTVSVGAPALLLVNPGSGQQGQQNLSVALAGQFTHWVQTTTTASFGAGITVASLTVNSATSATAVLNIDPSAATSARTVTLNSGTETAVLSGGFTVIAATSIALSINPNSGQQGQQNLLVSVTGQLSHFQQGVTQVTFGAGITVASLTVNSATSATALLNIDPTAATGPRTVIVATQGEVGNLSNGFTVTAGTPVLLSVSPNSAQQGQQNVSVVLAGQFTHWVQGTTTAGLGAGITVASLTVNSATSATAVLNIDATATVGARSVVLTTGSEIGTLNGGFSVTASAPTLLSVSPNSGPQGQQSLPVRIVGQFTHFLQGTSQVSFGAGITATSLTVNSPTSAAAILNIDYSATPGAKAVTLTTGAEAVTLANGFTVTAPAPALSSLNPNKGLQGQQNISVAITGQFTHFLQGSTTAVFGAGIAVASLTVNSLTSATAILNIDPAAAAGLRTVTVSTGSEVETLVNGFTVSSPSIGITVTPNPIVFGNVPVTTSSTQTVIISSSGSNPLTVSSISIAGPFFTLKNLPTLPLVLPPSSTATFSATFSPLGTISSTATITIVSNAASSPTVVQVSGLGIPPSQPPPGAITVVTDQLVYHRAQPVQISGAVTSSSGAGISNVPVAIEISVNGTSRILNPYTDAQGNYHVLFQPTATDGGVFSVSATATAGGATQTATTRFRVFGLLVNPSSPMQDLVMGTSLSLPLNLQNIGDAALNNLTYSVTVTPAGALTANFNQSTPTIAPGAPVTVPLLLKAPSGNPPPTPAMVQINITASDSVSGALDPETSTVIVTLRPAVSTLVLNPTGLNVGVNPGGSLTRKFAVQNNGYVSSNNSTVTLQDPATFYWVSFGGSDLGDLAPGTSQQFQVFINPPSNLALGNYTVLFNVTGGSNALQGTINISVSQSTMGAVAFVVSDDTGSKVGAATVTLYNSTTKKVFQGVTATDGTDTISGVDAGSYNYVVAAPLHDPGTGTVTVTANSTTPVNVLLSYDVVTLSFTVIPTSIVDQYSVALNFTYTTNLPKPALKVIPPQFNFSFFPADVPNGTVPCSLNIVNTSSTAEVRNVTVDTSQLDVVQPSGQQLHVYFPDGSALYQAGALAPTASTTVACYAKLDGSSAPTHDAGSIIVQGNYDFSLDGNLQQGTTATQVPVSYTRPNDLSYVEIPFIYDLTDPTNPVLSYQAGSFVYTVTSERPTTLNFLNPSGAGFNGHSIEAFVGAVGATSSLDVINANQNTVFWHSDFSNSKTSLLGVGDTATYDISALDGGLTLLQALQAQLAANPTQVLTQPMYLGFEGQWSDRSTPDGYVVPLNILVLTPDGIEQTLPQASSEIKCLNPEDPGCQNPDILPPDLIDGQLKIQIDQKIRLERQAFNAMLGIGALTTLNNTVASVQIYDANGNDASSNFFVLVTSDPLGATHGGTVSGQSSVSWQLIPNAGAGGTLPQGTQYQVQATLSYVVNGTTKTKTTDFVAINVLPSPQLQVGYTAPFVVVDKKDAKIRVTVKNVGYGPANNLTIQSTQPAVFAPDPFDPSIPQVLVDFNITGSSNTADSSGFIPGNLTINFGNVAPGATVAGYWTMQFSRRGFLSSISSTFTHDDYRGIQLDPLVLPPTSTLIPAIGGIVTNNLGQVVPNLNASLSLNGAIVNTDQTSATGEYYIQDLAAGTYLEQITDISGNVLASQNIVVPGNQATNFIDLSLNGVSPKGLATVTLDPASLSRIYDGTPKTVTATTNPAGLAVSLTYNGAAIAAATAGTYSVVATIIDPNYQGVANGTLTINQATPVITWPSPSPIAYGTALSGTQLDATATVGGSVVSSASSITPLAAKTLASPMVTSQPIATPLPRAAFSKSAPSAFNSGGLASPNAAAQLTPNSSSGAPPSPVGSNLAFSAPDSKGRYQIWTVQTDPAAQPIQQTFGGGGSQESREPSWSDITGKIAYQFGAPGTRAIFVLTPNLQPNGIPSISYRITSGCGTDERDPAWSPDGNYIAYSCFVTDFTQPVPIGSYQIWIHNNRGLGSDFPLVAPLDGTLLLSPTWSPDGQFIALIKAKQGTKGAEIAVVPVSGTSAGVVFPLTLGGFTNADPSWSPGGNRIAFSSTASGNRNIYSLDVSCLRLVSGCAPSPVGLWQPITTDSFDNTNPAWFRSGSLLAFVSNQNSQNGESYLYTIDSETPESAANPALPILVPASMSPPASARVIGDDPAWGASNLFGFDISDSAGSGSSIPWAQLIQAGQQFVIVDTFMGRNVNRFASSQLSQARSHGLRTAVYILLAYDDPNPNDPRDQVDRAIAPGYSPAALSAGLSLDDLHNLSFVSIDVEGFKGETLPTDPLSQANRRQYILNAISEVNAIAQQNALALRVIIYTRNLPGDIVDWAFLTGCADVMVPGCAFLGQPPPTLWDASPGQSELGNFTPYGVWTAAQRLGRQYCIDTDSADTHCQDSINVGVDIDLDVFDHSLFPGPPPSPGVSTPSGSGVTVQPINPGTGTSPVTLTFSNILQAGLSALGITGNGPLLPAGYVSGSPVTFYNLTTTALYSGLVQVCIDFSALSFVNPQNIRLLHYGSTAWADVTGVLNLAASSVCGSVTSLSPFAVVELSSTTPTPITGNFVYTPPAGTVLGGGTQTLSVTFTPSDTTNYATASASVPLQVTQATATVTLNAASLAQAYDGTPKSVTVTTSPPGLSTSVTYTLNGATVASPILVGAYIVTATITDPSYQGTATGTLTITGLAGCVGAPSGIVSWWTGDGSINDLLSVNNASVSNAVNFVPGEVGAAFTFGSGGFVDIPASPSLANQQFTWSAWVRPDGPGPNNDSFGNVIVGQDIDATHAAAQLLWRATDNRFLFVFGDNSSELIVSTDTFAPGQFYLVTGTYDGSTFKLFVNGNLEGQFAEAKTIAYSPLTWTIGSTDSTLRVSSPRTWNGVIDEVQAFNRALSQPEIQTIYAATSAGECKAQPAIASISPNSAQQGQQNVSVTLTGQFTNWVQGTTTAGFGTGITVVTLTVNSATSATAVLNIDPAAATGTRTVTLTTGSEIDVLPNGLTITPGTPVLLSVAPSTSMQGQQGVSVTLTGQYTNWVQGTTAATFGAGMTVTSLTVNSATSATAVLNIDPATPIGTSAVTLTTGSEVDTLSNGFTVTPGTPVLLSVTPNSGQQGQHLSAVSITGLFTHFVQGTTTASFGAGVTVVSLTVNSLYSATAVLNINATAVTGTRTVTLTTGSEIGILANGFTVTAGTLTQASVTPTSGQQGQQNFSVTLTGQFTNWVQSTTTVSFGPGIAVASLTISSPTNATAVINISGNTTPGVRTVTLTTGSEAETITNGFTVTPGTPVLQSVNPANGQQGQQNLTVVLTGLFTSWVQGTTTVNFGSGITVTTLTVNSLTSATALLNIDPSATPGLRTITLTTGTESETVANGFTIVAQTAVLVSVNPPTGQLGQQNLSVSLTGQFTNWVQGTTAANFGAGITISSLTVNSPTSATAVLTINPATTTGPRTVTMTTGSEVATLVNGFAISGGPMEVDAKPFSVMNLAGVTGGQPIQLETDAKTFSVLNTSGAGGTGGGQSREVDATDFSVLNLAGVTGGKPVPMETDALPFSVLNTAGPGGSGSSLTFLEVDSLVFSTLNLAGMSGNQPVQMEVDGVPFSVQNGPGPVAQAVPNKSTPRKQVTRAKATTKDAGTSSETAQDSGGTNNSSSIEKDKQ